MQENFQDDLKRKTPAQFNNWLPPSLHAQVQNSPQQIIPNQVQPQHPHMALVNNPQQQPPIAQPPFSLDPYQPSSTSSYPQRISPITVPHAGVKRETSSAPMDPITVSAPTYAPSSLGPIAGQIPSSFSDPYNAPMQAPMQKPSIPLPNTQVNDNSQHQISSLPPSHADINKRLPSVNSFNRPQMPLPLSANSSFQLPPRKPSISMSILEKDGVLIIEKCREYCGSFLPIADFDKILDTFYRWNKTDLSSPSSNTDLLAMLLVLLIGYKVTPKSHLQNPVFSQEWIDNLVRESSENLCTYCSPAYYSMTDPTAFLLQIFFLDYDESDHVGLAWSKLAIFTSSLQRIGFKFKVDSGKEEKAKQWLLMYKEMEKLVAFSMRTFSLTNQSILFPMLSDAEIKKYDFRSTRLAMFQLADNIFQNLYGLKHIVHPRNLSNAESQARNLAREFINQLDPSTLTQPAIRYQILSIQSLCNAAIVLVYRPYIVSTDEPHIGSELFRRKGVAAAIGCIISMLQFLECHEHTKDIYGWFAWVDIYMAAFEACVLLTLDQNARRNYDIKPDQNHLIKPFFCDIFKIIKEADFQPQSHSKSSISNNSQEPIEPMKIPTPTESGNSNIHKELNPEVTKMIEEYENISTQCFDPDDFNWRLTLSDKCRLYFTKLSTHELSRPAKAATILTAMLGRMKVTQVPKLFGPFNKISTNGHSKVIPISSRYIVAEYDNDFFAKVATESSLEFNQRIGFAINDTLT